MKEITTVGWKYVLMSGVLGSPTKQRLERGPVSSTLIVTDPGTISPRNPGFTGNWCLGNIVLGHRGAHCYCIRHCFLGHRFYFSIRMSIFLNFILFIETEDDIEPFEWLELNHQCYLTLVLLRIWETKAKNCSMEWNNLILKKNKYTIFVLCLVAVVIPDFIKKLICKDNNNNTSGRLFTFVYLVFIFQIGKFKFSEVKWPVDILVLRL